MKFFWFAACLAVIGCSTKENDPYHTRSGSFWSIFTNSTRYEKTFWNRTVEKRIHSELEPVMTAFITYWDSEISKTYVGEMRRQFRLSEDAFKKLTQEQEDEQKNYYVFIVSAATREPSWADFHKKSSMWRVTLENKDSSVQLDPERVELISKRDETAKAFYKKMDTFTETFKIRFSKTGLSSDELDLHIAGARGALVANFQNSDFKSSVDASANHR
jgi:hypothetical protein